MIRVYRFSALLMLWLACLSVNAQTMQFSTSNNDYEVTNVVSDVDLFDFQVEINNTPTLDPLLQVEFGAEYINDLVFDSGNVTLITAIGETDLT